MLRPASNVAAPLFAAGLAALLAAGVLAAEGTRFTPSQRSHWAWKRPVAAALPKVRNAAWARNPVDRFVLAKLDAAGLPPASTASREQLLRRVAHDLTGLPPTPAEQDAFLNDAQPGAYERMVDRYLASPAFGERWARHWLDVARYADSNGYEFDEARPDMWRYRDYVVRSFNADKPYHQFVREQLAGDEQDGDRPDARIATGFNLLGPDMTDAASQPARRQNTLNDMTDTAALAFLGLTVGCARCHDHKYEPITQRDYYRLQAFFTPAQFRRDLPAGTLMEQARFHRENATYLAKRQELRAQQEAAGGTALQEMREARLAKLPEDIRAAFRTEASQRNEEQRILVERHSPAVEPPSKDVAARLSGAARSKYNGLTAELAKLDQQRPRPAVAMGLQDTDKEPAATRILERGELAHPGETVTPAFPIILARSEPSINSTGTSTGRRSALAAWIASPEHPLTSRVMVNRVWQGLFGRGIVPTPSDFGVRGESPTHPELLDYLAVAFSSPEGRSGKVGAPEGLSWSIKKLIRLLVLSNTYRQSSVPGSAALARDPENLLFSRMNRKRLEGEAVRDGLLAVSGRLNPQAGGPGIFPPIPEEIRPKGDAWPVTKDPTQWTRRSLYLFVRRNLQHPDLEVFDAADTNQSCSRREQSTTAPQALALLNSPEAVEAARALARRSATGASSDTARLTALYRMALGRKPTVDELKLSLEFVTRQSARATGDNAWTDLSLALLNTNEFMYVD